MSRQQLKPRGIIKNADEERESYNTKLEDLPPPVASIQVMHHNPHRIGNVVAVHPTSASCDSSYSSSHEVEFDSADHWVLHTSQQQHQQQRHVVLTMNLPETQNSTPRRDDGSKQRDPEEEDDDQDQLWATLLDKAPPLDLASPPFLDMGMKDSSKQQRQHSAANPFAASPTSTACDAADYYVPSSTSTRQIPQQPSSSEDEGEAQARRLSPKPILRRRASDGSGGSGSGPRKQGRRRSASSPLTVEQRQQKQRDEIASILATLEELQHNFVTNDNSHSYGRRGSDGPGSGSYYGDHREDEVRKEFAIRHFPNGNLFSGNVDSRTGELIYGRMTCALEMEVYEGPFNRAGQRHGEGAVCCKMDGGAKFLGR